MNSEEIAKLANVSRSTVSRVVNNYKNVPEKTREKVMKIIDEYGYTPNISARTLAGKANNIIGLFIADINPNDSHGKWIGINSPYNMEFLSNVIKCCKKKGYLTLIYIISDLDECKEMEQYFVNRTIYGGIFIGFPYRTNELESLAKRGYNIVMVDQLAKEDDTKHCFKLANTDDFNGGYTAVKYLIDNGHRNIAYVGGDNRLSSIRRYKGYVKALEDNDIFVDKNLVIYGEYREDIAYNETKKLLMVNKPTAMFVGNDIMAVGVIRAIKENGLKVPEDISIIGFDDLDGSQWLDLNLTTMHTKLSSLAQIGVDALFSDEKSLYKEAATDIIIRGSVAVLKN